MSVTDASTVTRRMIAALPHDERKFLILDRESVGVPAAKILDRDWLSEQVRLRSLIWGIEDPFVLSTLWWYSASNWLVLPTIASAFLTNTALSPALDDVVLHWRADSRIPGASSTRVLTGPMPAGLAESLGAVIEHVASICGKGERRLWAFAVDSIAGRFIWLGHATGRLDEAKQAATDVIAAMPGALPRPRFHEAHTAVDDQSSSRTFVRRCSCCLLYKVPEASTCRNCPRQHPQERKRRLSSS